MSTYENQEQKEEILMEIYGTSAYKSLEKRIIRNEGNSQGLVFKEGVKKILNIYSNEYPNIEEKDKGEIRDFVIKALPSLHQSMGNKTLNWFLDHLNK